MPGKTIAGIDRRDFIQAGTVGTAAALGGSVVSKSRSSDDPLKALRDLQILDLSVPAFPSLIARQVFPSNVYAVSVAGTTAVLTGDGFYAHVVDISSASSPVWLGSEPGGTGAM